MYLNNGDVLLFIGDSITDCGRDQSMGQGVGLGEGYVALVNSILAAFRPEEWIRVRNTGIGGNRIHDLERRWKPDVVDLKPDWLSVMIGINDVWRQFDAADDPDQISIQRFEEIYRRLLKATRPTLKGLVLMSPFFLESNRQDPMRHQMDAYGEVVRHLAGEFDAIFIDVQAEFDRYLAVRPTQSLCGDRVHPNQTGHVIIAHAFLRAIGLDWSPSPGC